LAHFAKYQGANKKEDKEEHMEEVGNTFRIFDRKLWGE